MRVHAVRLPPGTDLKAALIELAEVHALRAGFILTCVGSLSHARLRMPGAVGEPETFATWNEPLEIVSLTGTLCADGVHLHAGLARRGGACVGGHLVAGCIVHTTAEVVLGEVEHLAFSRVRDPQTGCDELSVAPRLLPDDAPRRSD